VVLVVVDCVGSVVVVVVVDVVVVVVVFLGCVVVVVDPSSASVVVVVEVVPVAPDLCLRPGTVVVVGAAPELPEPGKFGT